MEIFSLIDRDYPCVSVLEDMQQIAEWLTEQDYYAVIDEQQRTIGIVTAKDTLLNPVHQLIDANISKPSVDLEMDLNEVFELMKVSHSTHLPVYEGYRFIGVISLWSLTEKLSLIIAELKQDLVQATRRNL